MSYATLAGKRICKGALTVPRYGVWWGDFTLDTDELPTGSVELKFGDVAMSGTVADVATGAFVKRGQVRVLGGGGGWGKLVARRDYHNDAGVKWKKVIADAASEVGETTGTLPTTSAGADYVRLAGPASKVLGSSWWVDYAGVTHVGVRPAGTTLTTGALDYDVRAQAVTLAPDVFPNVQPGVSIRDERWSGDLTVGEVRLELTDQKVILTAWCGDGSGQLTRALAAAVEGARPRKVYGKWRYRVVTMAGERVNLQAVNRSGEVPDLDNISQVPGLAGCLAKLKPSQEVYVEFLEGDVSLPRVTGFSDDLESLRIGADASAANAARQGDTVRVLLPPMVFTGTIAGQPATGVVAALTGSTLGTITTGSAKVTIG